MKKKMSISTLPTFIPASKAGRAMTLDQPGAEVQRPAVSPSTLPIIMRAHKSDGQYNALHCSSGHTVRSIHNSVSSKDVCVLCGAKKEWNLRNENKKRSCNESPYFNLTLNRNHFHLLPPTTDTLYKEPLNHVGNITPLSIKGTSPRSRFRVEAGTICRTI